MPRSRWTLRSAPPRPSRVGGRRHGRAPAGARIGAKRPARHAPPAPPTPPAPEPKPSGPPAVHTPPTPRPRTANARLSRLHLRGGLLTLARAELEQMAGASSLDREALVDLAEARWRSGDLAGAAEAAEAHLGARRRGADGASSSRPRQAEREGRILDARQRATLVQQRVGEGIERLFAGEQRARSGRWRAIVDGCRGRGTRPLGVARGWRGGRRSRSRHLAGGAGRDGRRHRPAPRRHDGDRYPSDGSNGAGRTWCVRRAAPGGRTGGRVAPRRGRSRTWHVATSR